MTTNQPLSTLQLNLDFGSEIPTERAPEKAAEAARVAAQTLGEDAWCDSEAPTGVAAERPLLPRPPSVPRV